MASIESTEGKETEEEMPDYHLEDLGDGMMSKVKNKPDLNERIERLKKPWIETKGDLHTAFDLLAECQAEIARLQAEAEIVDGMVMKRDSEITRLAAEVQNMGRYMEPIPCPDGRSGCLAGHYKMIRSAVGEIAALQFKLADCQQRIEEFRNESQKLTEEIQRVYESLKGNYELRKQAESKLERAEAEIVSLKEQN